MRCFRVIAVNSVESRIPVRVEGGETFIDLGEGKRVAVDADSCAEDDDGRFIEKASIKFAEDDDYTFTVASDDSGDSQALVLLPPTKRYSYVSLGKESLKLSSASKNVSLLVVLQKGNRILVTPQSDREPQQQTVLQFDGETILFKPLNQPQEKVQGKVED